jgi:tRNA (Thr-GGU) A37 N-methylase
MEPTGAKGIKGTIEIEPEYIAGLKDVEGFSHIFLLYHFHFSECQRQTKTDLADGEWYFGYL